MNTRAGKIPIHRRRSPLLAPLAFGVALCFAGAATAQTGSIEITDAWARATPGIMENGAAYLTIRSAAADQLIGAATPIAKNAGPHEMTSDSGIMRMRPLAAIDLPAGRPVTLRPGAVHIMLQGLDRPLRAGESFPLTLRFKKAGSREVMVVVEKAGAMGVDRHGGGMQMPMHH